MDYREKATILKCCSSKKGARCSSCPALGQGYGHCQRNAMRDASNAIIELMEKLERAEHCIAEISDQFDRGKCSNDYVEAILKEYYENEEHN